MKRWIIVADSGRARILEVEGKTMRQVEPAHHPDEVEKIKNKDKGVGTPARAIDSAHGADPYSAHVSAPHSDWNAVIKGMFAEHIANFINSRIEHFDKLILIAPSKVLGHLRKNLKDTIQKKIEVEISKDLTKASAQDIIEQINELKLCFPIIPQY